MLALLLLACRPAPDRVVSRLEAPPARRWSEGAAVAHHATVAFLPDDGLAVVWTRGELVDAPTAWLTQVGPDGVPLGPAEPLLAGAPAALPDVEGEEVGTVLVGMESPGAGLWLERWDTGPQVALADEALAAAPKNALDIAARPGGGACAVWYDETGAIGQFRSVGVDEELQPETGFMPEILAEVEAGASAAADVAADPDGGCAVVWNEQHADAPDGLWYQDFGPDGSLRTSVELDRAGPETPPRRATVAVDGDGSALVVWRRRAHEDWTGAEAWFAVVSSGGEWMAVPQLLIDEVADDPVVARVGDDTFWASWATWHSDSGWEIRGAIFDFPSGALRVGPISLSAPGDPHRPHVAARSDGAVAVSWEQPAPEILAVMGVRFTVSGIGPPEAAAR